MINFRQPLVVPVTAGLLQYLRHSALVFDVLADSSQPTATAPVDATPRSTRRGSIGSPRKPTSESAGFVENGSDVPVAVSVLSSSPEKGSSAAAQLSKVARKAAPTTGAPASPAATKTVVSAFPSIPGGSTEKAATETPKYAGGLRTGATVPISSSLRSMVRPGVALHSTAGSPHIGTPHEMLAYFEFCELVKKRERERKSH